MSPEEWIRSYGYWAVAGGMLIEQFVPLAAGEAVLLAGGALAATGRLHAGLAIPLALAGTLTADLIWYEAGRRGGHRVLQMLCRIAIEPDSCVKSGKDLFGRLGAMVLLISKFVPGLNSIGQPLAGALGMPRWRFVSFDAAGAIAWVGLYFGLGYVLGDQLVVVVAALVHRLGGWIAMIAVAAVGYLGFKVLRRQHLLRQLRIARITPEELARKMNAGEPVYVVDLRHAVEVQAQPMKIPGALRIDPGALEEGRAKIPRDRELILYCT